MRVFISFNSRDFKYADELHKELQQRDPGLSLFRSSTNISGGEEWYTVLAEEVQRCDAFLIVTGPSGLGPWQKKEVQIALSRNAETQDIRIVPIAIDVEPLRDPFLKLHQWISGKYPITADFVGEIAGALKSEGKTVIEPWRNINPYRGLSALTETDAPYFFGRQRSVATAITALAESRDKILTFVGNSGVGKSSLVRAGVFEALRQGHVTGEASARWPEALDGSTEWIYLTTTPGADPIRNLVGAFVGQWLPDRTDPRRHSQIDEWEKRVHAKGHLSELIDCTFETDKAFRNTPDPCLVLYIDQSEELFSTIAGAEAQKLFIESVAKTMADRRFRVLSSLRADYYGALLNDPILYPITGKFDVLPLSRDEIELIVKTPASLLSAKFENQGAIRQIVDDVVRQPGSLPLLSYLMADVWRRMQERGDGCLRFADALGDYSVSDVIARRADEFLKRNERKSDLIRRIFTLRLAAVRDDGEAVRRRAPKSSVSSEEEWHLIEEMAGPRWRLLVTSAARDTGEPVAEVAHEILLREWPTLKEWMREEQEFLIWRGRLEQRRRDFETAVEADREDFLLTGNQLRIGEETFAKRAGDLESIDALFIQASVDVRNKKLLIEEERKQAELARLTKFANEQKEIDEQRKRIQRSRRIGFLAAGGVAASIAAVAYYQIEIYAIQSQEAEEGRAQAVRKSSEGYKQCLVSIARNAKKQLGEEPDQCESSQRTKYKNFASDDEDSDLQRADCINYKLLCSAD